MKTIRIKKSPDFSDASKIYTHLGSNRHYLKGHDYYSLTINPTEELFVSQLWTKSEKYSYTFFTEGGHYIIKTHLGKRLALTFLILFVISVFILFTTKSRWSFIPLVPAIVYVGLYLTILKNKYFFLERIENMKLAVY